MNVFRDYDAGDFFDEMFLPTGDSRPQAKGILERIAGLADGELLRRQHAAERALLAMGITFNVYSDEQGTEKILPFDIVPRIVDGAEWAWLERGLKQRVLALNAFIDDVYHDQKILKDGVVPAEVILSSKKFLKPCVGLNPPRRIWCHISGIDLVRDQKGQVYVLEDNLSCPSGVSYVLENRRVMKRAFPQFFESSQVEPVEDYPSRLLDMLQYLASERVPAPRVAVMTPGIYNSAYFEHSFLAQRMGVELVEGRDLAVVDGYVVMRTTKGFERVDVIYRRINDEALDPKVFDPDSLLGVPGIMEAYQKGHVALVNAPGTGVADDKVVCAYVPDIIRYYLGEDAIIPNVPTYLCSDAKQRDYVLDHLQDLVVKAANGSGGYGMLIGPHATKQARDEYAERIKANPRDYIAQPTLALSRSPVIVDDHFEGRHVDLRPFVLCGRDVYVLPGGLTRVALRKGSLVVNSSQGGGTKDTWVIGGTRSGASLQSQTQRQ